MSCTDYKAVEQPPIWDYKASDDVYIKQLYIKASHTLIPQHAHKYAHTTLLSVGSVHVWAADKDLGVFTAPAVIPIPAEVKHTFISLVPDTLLYCIHNVSRSGEVEIHDLHEVV